jgi:YidC/Oxa1 family membrane protein insertase
MERAKLKSKRQQHGIYPLISMVNILQMPMHMVYISMINRLSYNFEINPAILNEGMLWFTDLSQPDPCGILPVLGGIVSLLNIMTSRTANSDSRFRKFRKFIIVMPLMAIPIQMTFPAVSSQSQI